MQFVRKTKNRAWVNYVKVKRGILELQAAINAEDKKLKKSNGETSEIKHAFSISKSSKRQIRSWEFEKIAWKIKRWT